MSNATLRRDSQPEAQDSHKTPISDFDQDRSGSQIMQQVNGVQMFARKKRFFKRKVKKLKYMSGDAEKSRLAADAIRFSCGFNGTKPTISLGPYLDDSAAREKLMHSLGSENFEFCRSILEQVTAVGAQGSLFDERTVHRMFSIITPFRPKSQSDAMMAAHVAVANELAMNAAFRYASAKDSKEASSAERAYDKFVRTFVYLVGVLERHHIAGERPVRQQRISITVDTQAISGIAQGQTPGINDAQAQTPAIDQISPQSLEKPRPAPPILLLADANARSLPLVIDSEHAAVARVPRRRAKSK